MKTECEISERRGEQRHEVKVLLNVQELSHTRKTPLARAQIRGIVFNASNNGIGVSTSVPLTYSAVVRCDIAVKDLPISVPTMAQVRWVERRGGEYRSGLVYLL